MKHALRPALVLLALAAVVPTAGCSKIFKKTVLPISGGTPAPVNPPAQAACVQGLSASSGARRAQAIVPAQLTVDSNPRGLKVVVNGSYQGSTPQSTTPPFANTMNKITVLNQNGGTDYQACYAQAANANATIFYNRPADTFGRITSIQDGARAPQSAGFGRASTVRRDVQRSQSAGSDYSGSAIEVRYRRSAASALRAGDDIAPPDAPYAIRVVHTRAGESVGAAIDAIKAQSGVVSAEPVQKRYLKTQPPIATPNDPHFGTKEQWDFYQVQALNGWSYTMGSPTIKIAVVDTGLDTKAANTLVQADLIPHLDFAESVLSGAGCSGAQTVTTGQAAVQDLDGHGTNVAGIAAAIGNNAAGFVGMAWNVKLQVYRIFDASGNACTNDEAKAIMDAVTNGARVINLSLGSTENGGPDQAERDAINYATAHNVLVVAAAGNEHDQGVENIDFPGAYPGVLAVGATSLNDGNTGNPSGAKEYVAKYSNVGPNLGIVAPGGDPNGSADTDLLHWISNLYSTTGAPPCSNPANCTVLIAGTSQATPHVTGAAALLLSVNPALTPAQLVKVLEGTADDIGDPNQGFGRLNIYRALAAASGDSAPPAYKPVNQQFLAFAYTNSGAVNAAPTIVNQTFPGGILVNSDGTFRIADIPTSVAGFKIGVWYDANGNGVVDAGDRFAATGACTQNGCSGGANLMPVVVTGSSFALP